MAETAFDQDTDAVQAFATEHEFTLPKGFVDQTGRVHRDGVMRLASALDEIAPMADPRVKENKAYLVILILSEVIVKLGDIEEITPDVIEKLFSTDLTYLQEFYRRINGEGEVAIPASCPSCGHQFEVEFKCLGK